MGKLQRDMWAQSSDSHYVGVLRPHASGALRSVRLLRRMFHERVRSHRIPLFCQAALCRANPGTRAVQSPSVSQGPRRLHGRQLPVCRRSLRLRLSPVSTTRVHGPSTRAVNSSSGNRALPSVISLSSLSLYSTLETEINTRTK